MKPAGVDNELQRRLELLAGKVLGDLTSDEQIDVDELLREQRWQTELWQLEAAAAAVDIRFLPDMSPNSTVNHIPLHLVHRLHDGARAFFESSEFEATLAAEDLENPSLSGSKIEPSTGESLSAGEAVSQVGLPGAESSKATPHSQPVRRSTLTVRECLAWLACAASLLLAVTLWTASDRGSLSNAEQREMLMSSADDIIQVNWTDGKTPFPTTVTGDVVWSTKQQQGFMRFRGMPVNDSAIEQYQLWIIDPARDKNPTDGGVFDVAAGEEVVIPIDAKLNVMAPAAFAITIEQPGGVVVSDQSRLPLLASVP